MNVYSVEKLTAEARRLAREYREATGKTLPITGEIAINDAIRLLQMSPASELHCGFDAALDYKGQKMRVQIKGRAIINHKKTGHRLGQLRIDQDWDAIILVIMDQDYEPGEIYLACRETIVEILAENKSRRGSISVARFKIIGELLWSAENGIEYDDCRDNIA